MAFARTGVRVEVVVFQERRYRRYPDSPSKAARTYFTTTGDSLHRAVWRHFNGPIPKGAHIHHKEGASHDTTDPEDLECVTPAEHAERHSESRTATGKRTIHHAREAARAWHSSPEGIAWHRQHAAESIHQPGKPHIRTVKGTKPCVVCGNPMEWRTKRRLYCGSACQTRASRSARGAR